MTERDCGDLDSDAADLAPEQCPKCRKWHDDAAGAFQCAGSHC